MEPYLPLLVILVSSSPAMASPQWNGGGGSYGGGWSYGGSGSSSGSAQSGPSSGFRGIDTSSSSFIQQHHVLIAHAVMASTAWAFLFPVGSIFLRLNINRPIMLKLHIFFQIFAYLTYVAAATMGIWLAMQITPFYDIWADPHPIIGLVILAFATIQPISGWIHHRIYRARATTLATTNRGPRPGRTLWGRAHLWLGRCLITLGIINGGLGLRSAENNPIQDRGSTRNAEIGYGIAAGLMWSIYASITVAWEWTRSARKRMQRYENSRMRRRSHSSASSDSSIEPQPKVPG